MWIDGCFNVVLIYIVGVGIFCLEVGDIGGMFGLVIGKGGCECIDYVLEELDMKI